MSHRDGTPARSRSPVTNRREFLRISAGAVAAPYVITSAALGNDERPAASERIVMGGIGLGSMGGGGMGAFLGRKDVHYVAVCDVKKEVREGAKNRADQRYGNKDCTAYNDFRELLARDDIDAVYIATPDHWHAPITIAAAKAGKHVYCQKPLTRTISEGRAVIQAVTRYGIVFQHGTQQRQDARMLFGCELVRNGYIGQLTHVKIGSPSGATCPPQPPQPIPPGLDWQMWLGPAPWAPFTPLRIQAHPWYHISDYCMGYIAGWGVHHADSAMQGSGLDEYSGQVEVDARGIFPAEGLFDNPYRWQMHYTFHGGLTWHWTDCQGDGFGSRADPKWPQHRMGITFEGSEGWVFIWRGVVDAYAKSLLDVKIGPNDRTHLVRPDGGPISDFIECVRQGSRTSAPVEVAHRSTTLCSLGAISMQLGRKVVWDAAKEEFPNDANANRLRSRAMREPWTI